MMCSRALLLVIMTLCVLRSHAQLVPVIDYGGGVPSAVASASPVNITDGQLCNSFNNQFGDWDDCTTFGSFSPPLTSLGYVELEVDVEFKSVRGTGAFLRFGDESVTLWSAPGLNEIADDEDGLETFISECSPPFPYGISALSSALSLLFSPQGWVSAEGIGMIGPFVCQSDNVCLFRDAGTQAALGIPVLETHVTDGLEGLIGQPINSFELCLASSASITGGTEPAGTIFSATLNNYDVIPLDVAVGVTVTPANFPEPIEITVDVGSTNGAPVVCYIQAGQLGMWNYAFDPSDAAVWTCTEPTEMDPIVCNSTGFSVAEDIGITVTPVQTSTAPLAMGTDGDISFDVMARCAPTQAPHYFNDAWTQSVGTDSIAYGNVTNPNLILSSTSNDVQLAPNYQGVDEEGFSALRCKAIFNDEDGTVDDLGIRVNLNMNGVGRSVMKVIAPDGTIANLVTMPGLRESFDGSAEGMGVATYAIDGTALEFTSYYARSSEWMGWEHIASNSPLTGVGNGGSARRFYPQVGSAGGNGLSDLIGTRTGGTWRFCVGVNAGGEDQDLPDTHETGYIGDLEFHIVNNEETFPDNVTEPATSCTFWLQVFDSSPCDAESFVDCTEFNNIDVRDCRSLDTGAFLEPACNPAYGAGLFVFITPQDTCLFNRTLVFESGLESETCVQVGDNFYAVTYDPNQGCIPPSSNTSSIEESKGERISPMSIAAQPFF